jgi:DNA polymerase
VANVLGFGKYGKDEEGHKNLTKVCKPQRAKLVGCEYIGGAFDESPGKHAKNRRYCLQDTVVECTVNRLAPQLPSREKKLWLAHQIINDRGVPVDIPLCQRASELVEIEYETLCKQLRTLTGREDVTPDCNIWLRKWLQPRGYPFKSLNEECVTAALAKDSGISDVCRDVLRIRQLASNSAVTKYQAILNHACADDRCRGGHVFYKAGPGRFAGVGVNFLNLHRLFDHETEGNVALADEIAAIGTDHDELLDYIDKLSTPEMGGVIPKLASMVRMAVCASPGKKLVVCDYSAIEMRMLHWLARDRRMLKTILDHDNGIGDEPYRLAAAMIYGVPVAEVTKPMRQVGKVFYLGCGYLASAPKVQGYAASQGIELPLEKWQEIVQLYRRSNPEVKRFWRDAGEAAVAAGKEGE